MRILLVEDDAMIGEAVVVALKDAACAVDWVRDGELDTLASGSRRSRLTRHCHRRSRHQTHDRTYPSTSFSD
jgi:hypothetical protein